MNRKSKKLLLALSFSVAAVTVPTQLLSADKPNILVIWGDELGELECTK